MKLSLNTRWSSLNMFGKNLVYVFIKNEWIMLKFLEETSSTWVENKLRRLSNRVAPKNNKNDSNKKEKKNNNVFPSVFLVTYPKIVRTDYCNSNHHHKRTLSQFKKYVSLNSEKNWAKIIIKWKAIAMGSPQGRP